MTNGTSITHTDYLSGYQYLQIGTGTVVLQFFPHSEGYVSNTVVNTVNTYNYVFNYTDHLGNNRLSYTLNTATNALTIVEENHYYPFGMKHNNYNIDQEYFDANNGTVTIKPKAVPYKYKYNGKEYQDELGLNLYDMDMRQYDPAIARWIVQDPVVHYNFSPYNAFDNNPVFWADPSGADSSSPLVDMFGRPKYDSNNMYIPPFERGQLGKMIFSTEGRGESGPKGPGFKFKNYKPGEDIQYLVVISNDMDKEAFLDLVGASVENVVIMIVDNVGGLSRGLEKLKLDGSDFNTMVINSHGNIGFFNIGNTRIDSDTIGGDGNFSILIGLGDNLKDKTLIVLACNTGQDKIGFDFTQEVSKQLQATVITSQHALAPGYSYNGSSKHLLSMNLKEKEFGDKFTLSEKGTKPITIYSLSMNNENSSTTYHFDRQELNWWFK